MSNKTILLSKLPLRKCPLHSKFSGSLQSSHSVSWNCSPTQYFDHSKNHLIKSRLRVPALRYYSPCFPKHSFVMPIATSSSNSKIWMWCNLRLWPYHSICEWNILLIKQCYASVVNQSLNLAMTSFMCQIMPFICYIILNNFLVIGNVK